jgi:ABC-type multidrug transport system permease subunit
MNTFRAIFAAFFQQWKTTAVSFVSLSFLLESIPVVAALAWIAVQSKEDIVLTYIFVGAPFMAIWNGVIFRIGWSLTDELNAHTIEFALVSRTPLIMVLFGKSLAQLIYGIPSGLIAFVTMLIVIREMPFVAEPGLLFISFLFVIIGLAASGLLLAPLMVFIGGKAGSFNAIIPFGVVLSGFLFPIDRLPQALEVVARIIPTSWAMSAVWHSIGGNVSLWTIAVEWITCVLVSAGIFGLTYILFNIIEKMIRVKATLQTY